MWNREDRGGKRHDADVDSEMDAKERNGLQEKGERVIGRARQLV